MLLGAGAAAAVSALMVVLPSTERLGVSPFWSWFLTGVQVTSLAAIGRGKPAAWLLGAAAQACWITYALLTGQEGFIPGCLLSLGIQTHSYLRVTRRAKAADAATVGEPARRARAA